MGALEIDQSVYEQMSDRDKAIIDELIREKPTLKQLGRKYGITRQRVSQILNRAGIDGRKVQELRTEESSQNRAQHIHNLAEDIKADGVALAEKGMTASQIDDILPFLWPDENSSDLKMAFDEVRSTSGLSIAKDGSNKAMSDDLVRASLYFVLARHLGLDVTDIQPSSAVPGGILCELPSVLEAQGLDKDGILTVLQTVGSGVAAEGLSGQTMSTSQYTQIRSEFLDENNLKSGKGRPVWPVTNQTVMSRLGGWNEALGDLGLKPNVVPEGFGDSTFSPQDYENSIREFKSFAADQRLGASPERYRAWVVDQLEEGFSRPSPEAIRATYGSWSQALNAGGDSALIERPSDRRRMRRERDAAQSAEQELVYAKEDEIERLDEQIDARRRRIAEGGESAEAEEEISELEYRKERLAAERDALATAAQRWKQQLERWAADDEAARADRIQQDKQLALNKRQFFVNLILSIAVALGSFLVPLLVWWLEVFGPQR